MQGFGKLKLHQAQVFIKPEFYNPKLIKGDIVTWEFSLQPAV